LERREIGDLIQFWSADFRIWKNEAFKNHCVARPDSRGMRSQRFSINWLEVNAMTNPVIVRENRPPYGKTD